jgi:hypothetical protein
LTIEIKLLADALLPHVYNLCFRPIGADGEINDAVAVPHSDINKTLCWYKYVNLIVKARAPKRSPCKTK